MAVLEMPTKTRRKFIPRWVLPPPLPDPELVVMLETIKALDLPGSDGEPMENARERVQINLALDSLDYHWRERDDYFGGGNMFVYFSIPQARSILAEFDDPARPRRTFRGPDVFVALGVDGSYRRQKWVVWEEDDHYPDVIFEFLSPSTRRADLGKKKRLYEQTFGTQEYFCFEYMTPEVKDNLLGWRLDEYGRYQPITPDERGWLWSEGLQLWVGTWQGVVARDETIWMRFYTPAGELVLTLAEAEAAARQAAEAEIARLQAELARLRGG